MNRNALLEKLKAIDTFGKTAQQIYTEISEVCVRETMGAVAKISPKTAYYFSIEYLMGRMFFNNLMALGILDETREIFAQKGFDLNTLEDVEDAALGSGGLGRLAACFLDSAAHLGYPVYGFGIRYKYGLFKQKIVDGEQVEEVDDWLKIWGDPWSVRREEEKIEVSFADMVVTAVPYDIPIYGKHVNILRLFQAEGSPEAEKISQYLYPADDAEEGKLLRIRQEYFFSAAAVGQLVKKFAKKNRKNFDSFPDLHVFQLNDTHAVFAVAEFLRLLTKDHGVTFFHAVEIAKKTFNYTNHTILPEALERWNVDLVKKILPDIAQILMMLHLVAKREWSRGWHPSKDEADMAIMYENDFLMANVAVYISGKVNGVAKIHSEILKEKLFFAAFHRNKEKFLNVTNGVTQRRWLILCNNELARFYDERLGKGWRSDFTKINNIDSTLPENLTAFSQIKAEKKKQLAAYIKKKESVELNGNAIFLSQIKRFHEYKRQLMTALAILSLYFAIKEGKLQKLTPMAFILGGKAASSYKRAKAVVKFINDIAKLVNEDADVNNKLQVVFVHDYCVSDAEKIVPGTDVSLQVSTAGFEASGTGNMKFMMNGAVTLGTMDGANCEIAQRAEGVSDADASAMQNEDFKNNYIFGATVSQIAGMRDRYDPKSFVEEHAEIKRVVNALTDGTFGNEPYLEEIYRSLFEHTYNAPDHYFVLYDLMEYVKKLLEIDYDYRKRTEFLRKQLINATHSSFFSSDRAIKSYARTIWHIR